MENFTEGDYIQYFKRELLSQKEKAGYKYVYEFLGECLDRETEETLCLFQSLENGQIFARSKEMFYSKVDKEKYPNIKQEYRFEPLINFNGRVVGGYYCEFINTQCHKTIPCWQCPIHKIN